MLQGDERIELTRDNIMFNHPQDAPTESHQYDIIDTIMVIKHALYRLKFRENMANLPSLRLITIIAAMDLEKATTVRDYFNKNFETKHKVHIFSSSLY